MAGADKFQTISSPSTARAVRPGDSFRSGDARLGESGLLPAMRFKHTRIIRLKAQWFELLWRLKSFFSREGRSEYEFEDETEEPMLAEEDRDEEGTQAEKVIYL